MDGRARSLAGGGVGGGGGARSLLLLVVRRVRRVRALGIVHTPILRIPRPVAVCLHRDALRCSRFDFTVAYAWLVTNGCMGLCWTLRSHRQGVAGGAEGPLREVRGSGHLEGAGEGCPRLWRVPDVSVRGWRRSARWRRLALSLRVVPKR